MKHLKFIETQQQISFIKQTFINSISLSLNLTLIESPLYVEKDSGIQDDLTGKERPIEFQIKAVNEKKFQIIHSLAKWKRYVLKQYAFPIGSGIITKMKALRPDENILDAIHSVYVDQWDWEKVICDSSKNFKTLESTVKKIYDSIIETEKVLSQKYSIKTFLPKEIKFIHTEELLQKFPDLSPNYREREICKKYGAVFLIGIGGKLSDGSIHDKRAPDYDDWTSIGYKGMKGLNGDILVWNPIIKDAFEISSMGIRVSPEILIEQVKICGHKEKLQQKWHQQLIKSTFPQTIGGGIGQSRLAMLLLQKDHIKKVQHNSSC